MPFWLQLAGCMAIEVLGIVAAIISIRWCWQRITRPGSQPTERTRMLRAWEAGDPLTLVDICEECGDPIAFDPQVTTLFWIEGGADVAMRCTTCDHLQRLRPYLPHASLFDVERPA